MTDVYQIGISIAMQNGVSSVLRLITGEVLGLNKKVLEATQSFGRLKLAIAGAAGVFVGAAMIKGLSDLSRAGEGYVHQLEQMKIAGMALSEVQASIAAANQTSNNVMSTTPTENLTVIRELRMALASADVRPGEKADPATATKEAIAHLDTFQKISGILSSVLSKDGKTFDGGSQGYELAKAAEILGLSQDPKKFDAVLEGWTQDIIASGGKLQGTDFFSTVKYLRGAGQGMSIEFLTKTLPSLMQELKTGKGSGQGGGAGNPLASMFAEIVGGNIGKKPIAALESIHMLDDTKVHYNKAGQPDKVAAGAILGSDVDSINPAQWIKEYLEPHLRKYSHVLDRGADGEFLHPGDLRGMIAAIFPNRTAQQVASMMLLQQNRIAGDRGLIESADKLDPAYDELIRHDPDLVRKAFGDQLERLKTDIGKAIAPGATEAIYQFTKALAGLADFVEHHETATKILEVTAGFAGLVTVLGGIAVATAVFSAAVSGGATLVAGITAIGGAIGTALAAVGVVATSPVWLAIAAGAAALGTGLVLLDEKFNLVGHIRAGISALTSMDWSAVGRHLTEQLGAARDAAGAAIGRLTTELMNEAPALLSGIGPRTLAMLSQANDAVSKWAADLATGVRTGLAGAWAATSEGLAGLVTNVSGWFAALPGRLWSSLKGSAEPPPELGAKITALFAQVAAGLEKSAVDLAASVKTGLANVWSAAAEGLAGLLKNLAGWFAALPSRLWASVTGSKVTASETPAQSAIAATRSAQPPAPAAPMDALPKAPVVPPAPQPPAALLPRTAAVALDAVVPQPATPQGAAAAAVPTLAARIPPSAMPSTKGTNSDPVVVHVANQISGNEIARGVSSNMAGSMNRPPGGYTGHDTRMDTLGAFYGSP